MEKGNTTANAHCTALICSQGVAGFTPLLFSELNHSAAETYMANRKEMDIIPVGDIERDQGNSGNGNTVRFPELLGNSTSELCEEVDSWEEQSFH
ncbi:MAG: hypothetical protein MK293_05655 [Pedosphaera sp.]|jgi:site-specific DNA-cytosine methylase|nr:hypothetical protein [Pedosphaera sp.]